MTVRSSGAGEGSVRGVDPSGGRPGRCEFREQTAQCVFVDGHPGCHVAVRNDGAAVAVRGLGDLPEDEYLFHLETGSIPSEQERGEARRRAWGHWDEAMVRLQVHELRRARAAAPRDWSANLPRLRREAHPSVGP